MNWLTYAAIGRAREPRLVANASVSIKAGKLNLAQLQATSEPEDFTGVSRRAWFALLSRERHKSNQRSHWTFRRFTILRPARLVGPSHMLMAAVWILLRRVSALPPASRPTLRSHSLAALIAALQESAAERTSKTTSDFDT